MHDALFRRQAEWNRLPDPTEFLAGVAEGVGADRAAYAACIASKETSAQVEASVAEARALGFNGTPSFQFVRVDSGDAYSFVGAQPAAAFGDWADALLAGEAPPQPKQPELPYWAKPEGLTPDPDRPGFTMAGDPYKGNPEAPLTVVEFTDLQCPSCRRHALEVQPAVDETFVETGEIAWVTKQLPLRMHRQAAVAAVAAVCAGDQGKYWEMQHLLYEEQAQWAKDQPDAELIGLAETLSLDMPAFTGCFNSRQALERVLDDIYDARGVASTTPTFVFVHSGRGAILRGARDEEAFLSILRRMRQSAEGQSSSSASVDRVE
jgi:protein-disulfide isomerase